MSCLFAVWLVVFFIIFFYLFLLAYIVLCKATYFAFKACIVLVHELYAFPGNQTYDIGIAIGMNFYVCLFLYLSVCLLPY